MTKYLIRLDDACPTMSKERWGLIESILDKYGVKPMVGVVPHNEDNHLKCDHEDSQFWNKVRTWEEKGWTIALHGYNHCYISENAGINPFWNRSEFAGVPLEEQKKKIRDGIAVFKKYGLNPKYFFAPSHTYDNNTIEALRQESDIRVICDSIGRKPYRKEEFIFIPQIIGHCTEIPISGIWTFCLHPNVMRDVNIEATESFIQRHHQKFISFEDIDLNDTVQKSIFDKMMSWIFFNYRKMKGLK